MHDGVKYRTHLLCSCCSSEQGNFLYIAVGFVIALNFFMSLFADYSVTFICFFKRNWFHPIALKIHVHGQLMYLNLSNIFFDTVL